MPCQPPASAQQKPGWFFSVFGTSCSAQAGCVGLPRALNSCPMEHARVVILGQDPYHNTGQAMGLSFSVPRGQPVPSSLKNIYTELKNDCGCVPPRHGDLQQVSHHDMPGEGASPLEKERLSAVWDEHRRPL